MTFDREKFDLRNVDAAPIRPDMSKLREINPQGYNAVLKANEGNPIEQQLNPDPGLPGELREVAETVARMAQVSQSAANLQTLAIVASCMQGHYDVKTWWSQGVPTSIYTFVVAGSGERKSSSLKHLIKGVLDWDREKQSAYKLEAKAHKQTVKDAKNQALRWTLPNPF